MGGGRFMKSIRAKQQNGLVFVKVIMKPFPTMELEPYIKAITSMSMPGYFSLQGSNDLTRGTQSIVRCAERVELSEDS